MREELKIVNNALLEKKKSTLYLLTYNSFLTSRRKLILYETHTCIDVDRRARGWTRRDERRGRRAQKYLVHDKCPDTHHGATTSRARPSKQSYNAASRNHYAKMQSPDNRRAAPSRSLISPICTAVGERKQNGNERLVPPGWMIRDKEGSVGGCRRGGEGREKEARERERTDNGGRETGEIRKEINSAIDKRPVKRQSAPVWVDEALSILDKKHNRRYPGGYRARGACFASLFFPRFARIFFLSYRKVESTFRNTHCNARDLFRFASPFFLIHPHPRSSLLFPFFQRDSAISLYCW